MKYLYLIRHAETEYGGMTTKDHDRNLTDVGIESASKLGNFMKVNNYIPDIIAHSTANRVKQTLEHITNTAEIGNVITESDKKLYLPTDDYLFQAIEMFDDKYNSALIVSHNPAISGFLHKISQGSFYECLEGTISIIKIDTNNWVDSNYNNMSLLRKFTPEKKPC